jgi:hypothetical protein
MLTDDGALSMTPLPESLKETNWRLRVAKLGSCNSPASTMNKKLEL